MTENEGQGRTQLCSLDFCLSEMYSPRKALDSQHMYHKVGFKVVVERITMGLRDHNNLRRILSWMEPHHAVGARCKWQRASSNSVLPNYLCLIIRTHEANYSYFGSFGAFRQPELRLVVWQCRPDACAAITAQHKQRKISPLNVWQKF
jgi:hypothetical protein